MPAQSITISLATEEDAPTLASIMTSAFSVSDAAYPLIWGRVGDEVHANVSLKGLFSPVQRETRLTFKAVSGKEVVGFATWNLPKPNAPKRTEREVEEIKKSNGLPKIPGVNMDLWGEKINGPKEAYYRDFEESEDILLSFLFVLPEHQRQGIGSLLLQGGLKKSHDLKAKIWLASTPQAMNTYERHGWKIVQRYEVDLGKYGREGLYGRAWMLREPEKSHTGRIR